MKKINLPLIKPILPPATIATKIGGNLLDRVIHAWEISKQAKVEIKRIEAERYRIHKQYKIAKETIRAEYNYQLKKLEAQKQIYEKQIKIFLQQYTQHHELVMNIIKLANDAMKKDQFNEFSTLIEMVREFETKQFESSQLFLNQTQQKTQKLLEV